MQDLAAMPYLIASLEDVSELPIVRHEAAEALGALSDSSALPILEKYLKDPEQVVRETCELAVAKIQHEMRVKEGKESPESSIYASVDPAPALKEKLTSEQLESRLMDDTMSLFDRYKAMFTLRNLGTEEAVLALAKGFEDDSALFRHEIGTSVLLISEISTNYTAYVFGQMQHPASVPSLMKVLENELEDPMVRHECAEALGSIATDECMNILQKYATSSAEKETKREIVRESCLVGLDIYDYEVSTATH